MFYQKKVGRQFGEMYLKLWWSLISLVLIKAVNAVNDIEESWFVVASIFQGSFVLCPCFFLSRLFDS